MNCAMSVHLGVYALGAADTAERSLVEAHLGGCPVCRAELARLEPLPGLLARVPLSLLAARAPPARVPGLAAAGRIKGGRAMRWRALAATAAAAAAVGAAAGFWLAQPGASPAPAITLSGANPATHVYVTVRLTATSWGTSIQLVARGLPENVACRLIIRSRTGESEVTGVWNAWSAGPVTIPASAGVRPADIASLRVATTSRNLVTITTRRAAAPGPAVPRRR
jgi:anti-sigma-K factor RskA